METAGRRIQRWAAAALLVGAASLSCSLAGLVWDIAWHVDLGRDRRLFTPPHAMTLAGLAGFGFAAVLAIAIASRDRAPVPRFGGLRVPRAAVPILAMSALSVVGFPLDDAWHRVYGIDVTLWSPTHLLMIGGAILSTFGFALLAVEGGYQAVRGPRWLGVAVAAGPLLGLSVLQLEFDFGVPQWQAAWSPVLVGLTGAVCLVGARAWLGRWGAVWTALAAAAAWALLALLVGGLAGLTAPRFPLYLGAALAAEAAFVLPTRMSPAVFGAAAGALVAAGGVLLEWPWNLATGYLTWTPGLLADAWPVLPGGAAGGVVGFAAGTALAGRRGPSAIAVAASVAVLAAASGILLPRQAAPGSVTVRTAAAGPSSPVLDRFGRPSSVQPVLVEVDCVPAAACDGASWFAVVAWQGGGRVLATLDPAGGGRFVARRPVPTGGAWKTIVLLDRGPVVAAAPVSLPDDLEYGTPAVPVLPERTEALVAAPQLLETESHDGPPLIAVVAAAALAAITVVWLVLLGLAYRAMPRPAVKTA